MSATERGRSPVKVGVERRGQVHVAEQGQNKEEEKGKSQTHER